MEGPPPVEIEHEPPPVPDLLEAFADKEVTIFGVTGTFGELARMCPVDLSDPRVTLEAKNDFVVKTANEAGMVVESQHETVFRTTTERLGLEPKFTILSATRPKEAPEPERPIVRPEVRVADEPAPKAAVKKPATDTAQAIRELTGKAPDMPDPNKYPWDKIEPETEQATVGGSRTEAIRMEKSGQEHHQVAYQPHERQHLFEDTVEGESAGKTARRRSTRSGERLGSAGESQPKTEVAAATTLPQSLEHAALALAEVASQEVRRPMAEALVTDRPMEPVATESQLTYPEVSEFTAAALEDFWSELGLTADTELAADQTAANEEGSGAAAETGILSQIEELSITLSKLEAGSLSGPADDPAAEGVAEYSEVESGASVIRHEEHLAAADAWRAELTVEPEQACENFSEALRNFVELTAAEVPLEGEDTVEGASTSRETAAAEALKSSIVTVVTERLIDLEADKKEAVGSIIQDVVGVVHSIHLLEVQADSAGKLAAAKIELAMLCEDLLEALDIEYQGMEVQQFVRILTNPDCKPLQEVEAMAAADLERSGTREAKIRMPRLRRILVYLKRRLEQALGKLTLWGTQVQMVPMDIVGLG